MNSQNIDMSKLMPPVVVATDLNSELRYMKEQSGKDKNALAVNMIHVCLAHGINTAGRIIATLRPYGLNNRHIGAMLHHGAGHGTYGDQWKVEDGVYVAI